MTPEHPSPTQTTTANLTVAMNPAKVTSPTPLTSSSPSSLPPSPSEELSPPSEIHDQACNEPPNTHALQLDQATHNVVSHLPSDTMTLEGNQPQPPLVTTPQPLSPRSTSENSQGPPHAPHDTLSSPPHPHSLTSIPGHATGGQSAATTSVGHAGRVPPPAGTFIFNSLLSLFIAPATLQYLQTIPAGRCWEDMIVSYLRLEEFPVTKGVCVIFICSDPSHTDDVLSVSHPPPH